MDSGLDPSFKPWVELGAFGVILALFVWYQCKRIPAMQERNEARLDAKDGLFVAALQSERDTRARIAEQGHEAAAKLGQGVADLAEQFRRHNDFILKGRHVGDG